jgi:hypothetical protein
MGSNSRLKRFKLLGGQDLHCRPHMRSDEVGSGPTDPEHSPPIR